LRALLDTHVFLWWMAQDPRLSEVAVEAVSDGNNELLFSAASGWEMAIKAGLGKLRMPGDLGAYLSAQLSENAVGVLPVSLRHATGVARLPGHHRDPFDRLLISQALAEDLPIVTADPLITEYPVETVW